MQEITLKLTRELRVFYNEHNENCTNCGSSLSEGDCVHLGYLSEDRHAVLCDKCCHLLSKTVIRYHWMEKEYTKPAPEEKLWRYMDLSKFISLISTKQLYFASASSFDDPFEGAKGLQKNKTKWDNYYLDFFEKAVRTAPGMDAIKLSDEKVNNDAKRLLQELSNSSQASRNHTFISCWHSNEYESEAMWKLYSKDTSNAVAIQTTGKRLYLALD